MPEEKKTAETPVVPAETGADGNGPETPENLPEDEDVDTEAELAVNEGSNAELRHMMDRNFIEYASYVIKERAIPDVDDGFKPVQRRILWAMHLCDDGTFHKVAGIIGDTMKFHPHGDASIGDALVVLANKELFIEKQGNYGSIITGESAAAPRYIEARLSVLGREVLFNDDITETIASYDGRREEAVCLPVKIPSLLLMGSDGIAVGTNTRILPHNFKELLNAQIAILKDEPFQIYPDFFQGGIMDASEYEDGNGKITLRAKIDVEGRTLVIREIPAFTTTEKLMDSIEKAANKNKIKIASIHDLTAENVCIEIVPQRGYDPQRAIQALFQYTDCSMTVSLNLMVICENRPERMTVPQVLNRNTGKLLEYLRAELQIEIGKYLDRILFRTLAQIFIEERIYKRIEKCKTNESIFKEVRDGLEDFREEWAPIVAQLRESVEIRLKPEDTAAKSRLDQLAQGIIPDSEVEKLLAIPIRRISMFDIEANRHELDELNKLLATAEKNLKKLKQYAIRKLQELIDKYGDLFPRKTVLEQEGFSKIDLQAIALNNIRVCWDRKNCYIGTHVKSDDVVVCNEYDHLLCIERKGEYKIIDIPEKIFIDRLYEFRKYDKTTVFGIVYSDTKTGKVYYKRCVIDKFIRDKVYRICPANCRLELVTPRPMAVYECQIDTPIKSRKNQTVDLSLAPLRSPKAGGALLFPRKLQKITFVRYLDENDAPQPDDPPLIDLPPDPPEESADEALERIREQTPQPDPVRPKPSDEEENWGISQPDLGF